MSLFQYGDLHLGQMVGMYSLRGIQVCPHRLQVNHGSFILTTKWSPLIVNNLILSNITMSIDTDYSSPAIFCAGQDTNYIVLTKSFERSIVDKKEASIYREALRMNPLSLSMTDKLNLSLWKANRMVIALSRRILRPGTLQHDRMRRMIN